MLQPVTVGGCSAAEDDDEAEAQPLLMNMAQKESRIMD
jgi:hypothetical protein